MTTTGDVIVMCVIEVSLTMYRGVHTGAYTVRHLDCLTVLVCDNVLCYTGVELGTVFVTA